MGQVNDDMVIWSNIQSWNTIRKEYLNKIFKWSCCIISVKKPNKNIGKQCALQGAYVCIQVCTYKKGLIGEDYTNKLTLVALVDELWFHKLPHI